jgi:hypothetical protein
MVDQAVLDFTVRTLAEQGEAGQEGFVIWGANLREAERALHFQSCIFPRQLAVSTPEGLLVTVDGESLFEVNRTLFERGEILAGQAHTHPTGAYHSDTDDAQPIVTLLGGISVVLPDFARDGFKRVDRWAWYRLEGYGKWVAMTDKKIEVV